jgi:hypothetical protein
MYGNDPIVQFVEKLASELLEGPVQLLELYLVSVKANVSFSNVLRLEYT